MSVSFDFWKILAGIAIFLLGMNLLETSLKQLAGRRFKLFLKKQTAHKLRAVGGGAVVTGILQSSSVVNLMVLAFVSTGILSMQNALALMLGSNLGTTLSGWLVATLGFKLNIESFAYPITGIAGILMMLLNRHSRWYQIGQFLLGFGFLFVGLSFMKSGVEEYVKDIDLSALTNYPLFIFLLMGILITSLIQSSSATIAITLTALHAGILTLQMAAVLVIGSEIGTTFKLLLAAARGPAITKRVALGNFLFNIITALIILILLNYVLALITDVLQVRDQLIALVFFQSLINITGIFLFYPFLTTTGKFLEKRFRSGMEETMYISKIKITDTELALVAFKNETVHLLNIIIAFCFDIFEIDEKNTTGLTGKDFEKKPTLEKYEYIKTLHGEIHSYYVQLQSHISDKEDTEQLDLLISSVRNSMYAAKSMKDAYQDTLQLRNSSNESKYSFYLEMKEKLHGFLVRIKQLANSEKTIYTREELAALYNEVVKNYNSTLAGLYHMHTTQQLNQVEISTIINFSRELFTCLKSLIFSIKGCLLTPKDAIYFNDLPGFIR